MTRETARLEREIEEEKSALAANLHELEAKARALTDWRHQVRRHPLASVGVALAGGVALALIAGGGNRGARADQAAGPSNGDGDAPHQSLLSHPLLKELVATFATVAATRAFDLFADRAAAPTPPSRTDDPQGP
ncbi:MAG: hypothetical protein HY059_06100 [Proteobacteria bacterium]|nr:hypothetical protein [Pseudomonadota bacterium]